MNYIKFFENFNEIQLVESKTIQDFEPLKLLYDDFGPNFWEAMEIWCGLKPDMGYEEEKRLWIVWIVKQSEKTIGVCGLYSLRPNDNSELWLAWFAILPEYRNGNLGGKVLTEMEKRAIDLGAYRMFTYVGEDGKPLNFYYRNGFKRIGTVGEYIDEHGFDPEKFENELNDHVLMKELK